MNDFKKYSHYAILMRLHKPIPLFLLLWPTLWALWIASNGHPDLRILGIFLAGVVIMRSAGCIINDLFDRQFDALVTRTKNRPLVTGKVTPHEAKVIFVILCFTAACLVLQLNKLTIFLALIGLAVTIIYPLMKRVMHLPQLVLGVAFSWGVPMAFAAQLGYVPAHAWLLFAIAVFWPLAYDSIYALMDKQDDIKAGIKSSVILFDTKALSLIPLFHLVVLIGLFTIGMLLSFHWSYYFALFIAALCVVYQITLVATRNIQNYYKAFNNNLWMGFFVYIGIMLNYFH